MQNYREQGYIENKKPVDEKYNNILGTPINEKYSVLIYAKIKELEKIHPGGYYSTGVFTIEVEGEDKIKRVYVVKQVDDSQLPVAYLKKFQAIKKAKLPTFDEAFILSGDYPGRYGNDKKGRLYFVSTLLNSKDKVILAKNWQERNFPLGVEGLDYEEIFKNRLRIKNFQKLIKEIFHELIEVYNKHGVYIGKDGIFFNIPINHKQEEVEIGWLVGDFDHVYYDVRIDNEQKMEIVYSFNRTIQTFIRTYCLIDEIDKYEDLLNIAFDQARNKILNAK